MPWAWTPSGPLAVGLMPKRSVATLQICGGFEGLLDEDVSLDAAWSSMQKGRPTPEVTVEAIKQAVREGGASAFDRTVDQTEIAEL